MATMTPTRSQPCPSCGSILNATSDLVGDAIPDVGDITICIHCKSVLVFDEAMEYRFATKDELKEIDQVLQERLKSIDSRTYTILHTSAGEAILCHKCGYDSSNKNDVKNLYCGRCHEYHQP